VDGVSGCLAAYVETVSGRYAIAWRGALTLPAMPAITLSVLIPLYNEEDFIAEVLDRVHSALAACLANHEITSEVIVVDDASSDESPFVVEQYRRNHPEFPIRLLHHPNNWGKGAAIRTALAHAEGQFSLIQDADLEYDPADYARLLRPLLAGDADLVIGSRFLNSGERRVLYFWHALGNRALTTLTNVAADLNLTDMAGCYKAFRTALARSIPLRSERFGLDAELPIKFARRGARIYETPVSYLGRTYEEGKKIRPRDAIAITWAILHAGLTSGIHVDAAASMLCAMEHASRFNRWMADRILPFIGDEVLEIGAGIGNLTRLLCSRRRRYVVTDLDREYLERVQCLVRHRPNVTTAVCDVSNSRDFEQFRDQMDTAVCLNVLEHVKDDMAGLRNIYSSLKPEGCAILLVPQGPGAFGSFDRILGHFRRYTRPEFEMKIAAAGFALERVFTFNRATYPGWILNSKLLRRKGLSRVQLVLFDRMIPLLRRLDRYLPWPATSLVAVCRRPAEARRNND
jgi:2-polyprenyl-3-methyl-5-hydroxy-6-metoxy-1,4-benzoquinol methylase